MVHDELIIGIHAVRHALDAHPERALELWLAVGADSAALREIRALGERAGVTVQGAGRAALDRLAGGDRHQGVVLRRRAAPHGESDLDALIAAAARPLILALDGVYDPHNLGACLRTADAAGAIALLVPMHRGTALTPAAAKAASGAAERLPVIPVRNLVRALNTLKEKGLRVIGAAADATRTVFEADLTGPLVLVAGAEDRGLRRLTAETCDELVRIPMAGAVASLNVSVAAAICLYEAVRQGISGRK
jgi:23S rRNA (guanosine2251-2'-O)-methyltransferase